MSQNRFSNAELIELNQKWVAYETRMLEAVNERGNAFFAAGDYPSALNCFQEALQRPYLLNAPILKKKFTYDIGCVLVKQGQYSKAIATLERAENIIDNDDTIPELDVDLFYNLGLSYYELNDFQKAVKYFKKAKSFNNPNYNRLIQFRLHFLKEFDEDWLIAKIDEAETNPNSDDNKTAFYYKSYSMLKPNEYNAWNNQAGLLNKLQAFKSAKKTALKAIQINRQISNAWRHLGNAYFGLQKYDKAERSYLEAIRLDPKYKEAWINLGELYLLKDRVKDAIETYHKVCAGRLKNPENREMISSFDKKMTELGEKIFEEGRQLSAASLHEQAIKKYQICLNLAPNSKMVWSDQAYSLNQLGRYHEAIASCQRAIQLKADFANPWHHCGNAYVGLQDYKNALQCYNKALQLKPNDKKIRAHKDHCQKLFNELTALQSVRNQITYKIKDYKKTSQEKVERATILGFTLFHNLDLHKKHQQLADDLIAEAKSLSCAADAYPLLQRYIEDDKTLAQSYDKEPATFTESLTELTQDMKRFVRK